MSHRLALRVLAAAFFAISGSTLSAQVPFAKDLSIDWLVEDGLPSPASLARDPVTGVIFASSLYDKFGPGTKTDIYRIQPDGTVEIFTAPIRDPDVLTLDAAGFVYVGSYPGRITKVDPVTGLQTVWASDNRLGNVDGMAFRADGNLLVSAIDHSKILLVDATTRVITDFADLTSLGAFGFGSIAVHGSDVYVAAPKDGFIAKLDGAGNLVQGDFRSGLSHVGQLAVEGDFLFASDNPVGEILRYDLTGTLPDGRWIFKIPEFGGGFLAVGDGRYFGSWQAGSLSDGGIYRAAPMELSMAQPPQVGGSWELDLDSPSDAGRSQVTFVGLSTGSIPLSDGRSIPANLQPGTYLLFRGLFDPSGHWDLDLAIPDDPSLVGLTVYVNSVSLDRGFFGITSSLGVTLQN